jgi:putative transposase
MADVRKGRGYVYSLQYHIVWCTKYRRKVLTDDLDRSLKKLLHHISADNGFAILEYNSDKDHVHLLIDCTPQHYIPNMVKALKGVSARLLMKEYGERLREKLWGGHLWNPSYYIATVSENTEEQVRSYIRSQKPTERDCGESVQF